MTTVASADPAPPTVVPPAERWRSRRILGFFVLVGGFLIAIAASIAVGANMHSISATWQGLVEPSTSEISTIVWSSRVPRTILAAVAGAAFGVSGALIQALTRNPLADPGILGVNAGATFTVSLGVGIFGVTAVSDYIWFALIGAAAATVLVYFIGTMGQGSANPVTLVLAGVALGAVLGGFSTFLSLLSPETFRSVRAWGVGSVARAELADVVHVLPFIVVGLVLALALTGSLNSLALGDDLAASLGVKVGTTRVLGVLAVTLLAGAATALTGGVAFVGLMVPHIVRWFTGPDQRWILAYSILAAPVLVLLADVIGRVIAPPQEIQVGILTAVIGAPVLIALVRRRKASGL
ncbi:MAG: FecCD family ABC transporter permease [Micrococcaceae bacterium]